MDANSKINYNLAAGFKLHTVVECNRIITLRASSPVANDQPGQVFNDEMLDNAMYIWDN